MVVNVSWSNATAKPAGVTPRRYTDDPINFRRWLAPSLLSNGFEPRTLTKRILRREVSNEAAHFIGRVTIEV